MWAGMQAVMFCAAVHSSSAIDFWWIKPQEENDAALERHTLDLHTSGDYRNSPESSRAAYQPFADMFATNFQTPSTQFGVETVEGCRRAYIDFKRSRMWVFLFWQESFSTMPWNK